MAARFNYVKNPKAANNVSDGWVAYGYDMETWERVTSVPGVSLPDGFTTAFKFKRVAGTSGGKQQDPTPTAVTVAAGETWTVSYWAYVPGTGTVSIGVREYVGAANYGVEETSLSGMSAFVRTSRTFVIPATVNSIRPEIFCKDMSADAYITGWLLEKVGSVGSYGDGDTTGWHWEGTAHNSFAHYPDVYSLVIDGGAASTDDNDVVLTPGTTGAAPSHMCFSEDGGVTWSAWQAWATTRAWELEPQTTYPTEARTILMAVRTV